MSSGGLLPLCKTATAVQLQQCSCQGLVTLQNSTVQCQLVQECGVFGSNLEEFEEGLKLQCVKYYRKEALTLTNTLGLCGCHRSEQLHFRHTMRRTRCGNCSVDPNSDLHSAIQAGKTALLHTCPHAPSAVCPISDCQSHSAYSTVQ